MMTKKEMWVGWTRDGIRRYEAADDIKKVSQLVEDMAEIALAYADKMLEGFEERFGGEKDAEEEDEDDDDDDDDED